MLNYSDLRDIQRREMESSDIVNLPADFFGLISEMLNKKKDEALEKKSLIAIKEYENIRKIVEAIANKREEKIMLIAVRGGFEGNGLTKEERELLKELTSIINKSRDSIKTVWDNESDSQKIRMIKDIEKYRGIDDNIYGPFKIGQEENLPKPEAQWLLKSGMAEMVKT